jgi:serine phosphatase RsbU (regulator of sigma subunit)
MYVPRDKVSGDFYWWTKMKLDNIYVLTVADCTGHGVPGAFMSMLGISMLNEIVNKEYFWHPPVILRKMRKDIINSLKQSGEIGEMKDGMDMAIVSINMDTMELQFAGANNSLLLITEDAQRFDDMPRIRKMTLGNKTLYEFLPDKMPISVFDRMNKFSVHEINVVKGDQFYIFSDGYADQFGGSKGKKFMMKKFKTLLMENCDKPMAEQKQALVDALNQWQGNLDQVDDITVMGVRL